MNEPSHFKYNNVVHLGPLPPEPVKIKSVKNLIPIEVEYEVDGHNVKTQGYVDYSTMEITLPSVPSDRKDEVEKSALNFLMGRATKYDQEMESVDIPSEVYEEAQAQMNRTNRKPEEMKYE